MSNWLGFSLSPQQRIEEEFSRQESQEQAHEQEQEHEDGTDATTHGYGSLSVVDQDWRYDMGVGNNQNDQESPKLEDFLGCYSNSQSDDHTTKIYDSYQTQEDQQNQTNSSNNNCTRMINVNLTPSFTDHHHIHTHDLTNPYQQQPHLYHHHQHHYMENNPQNQTLIIPNTNSTNPNLIYNHQVAAFERASSVSGFKSWLRQTTPFCPESSTNDDSNPQSLSLAISPNSNDGSDGFMVQPLNLQVPPPLDSAAARKRVVGKSHVEDKAQRKSIDNFGQRTSQYRGVTRHRWTGRYEAHLWDNSCRKEGQTRKGRQVYLGGYDKEEKAARAYDLAALKYWGPTTHINFPLTAYQKELDEMRTMTRQEFVAMLRRNSSGFSRGASVYRGVTRHHQHGRWQARIGRVAGNKDLYLGTFSTQEEAAEAYDIAAIKFRGTGAVTNFNISRYDVKRICSSSTLIASDLAKRPRSPKELPAPISLEDYASMNATQQLAIEPASSDELANMVWNANQESGKSSTNTDCDPSDLSDKTSQDGNGGDYLSNNGSKRVSNSGLVHQVPMFALWND